MPFGRTLAAAFIVLLPLSEAISAEVDFEGFYRARGRLYHSLSIDRDLDGYEGTSWWIDHRFWLKPKFLINEHVGVFAEIKALDNMVWGKSPNPWSDPSAETEVPLVFTDDLYAEQSTAPPLLDITLWRAWGEVHVANQTFRVGRMPLHWGSGVWQNDGLGFDAMFGDTTDRVQWEGLFEPVYVSLAVDINADGFVNQRDQTVSYNALAAWRTEQIAAGFNLQYRRSNTEDPGTDPFDLFTADIALDANLGPIEVHLEGVGHIGSGDLDTGLNDVRVFQLGGAVDAMLHNDNFDFRLVAAFATGDANPSDNRIKTFAFDRDYNLGIVLFEQPMPVLEATVPTDDNGGRDYGSALSGQTITNAVAFAPELSRELFPGWTARAKGIFATRAKNPDLPTFAGRRYYGTELDVAVDYTGIDYLDVALTGAAFLPGGFYKNAPDLGDATRVVWGLELSTRIRF